MDTQNNNIRKIFIMIIVLATTLVFGILFFKNLSSSKTRASYTGPILTLIPSNKSAKLGSTISFNITMNTNGEKVSAMALNLKYDPVAVKVISLTPLAPFPVVLAPLLLTNPAGTARIWLGSPPATPFQNAGIIGVLKVKILSRRTSRIVFIQATQVAALGKTNSVFDFANSKGTTITVVINGSITGTGTSVKPKPSLFPSIKSVSRCGETNCLNICKKMGKGCSSQDWMKNKCIGKYVLGSCVPPKTHIRIP